MTAGLHCETTRNCKTNTSVCSSTASSIANWSEEMTLHHRNRSPGSYRHLIVAGLVLVTAAFGVARADEQSTREILSDADRQASNAGSSPVRRIDRRQSSSESQSVPDPEIQSLDGHGNNLLDEAAGAAETQLARLVSSDYGDGIAAMAGSSRMGPRHISSIVSAQATEIPNSDGATDFLWLWGQFLDHDIDLTDGTNPPEPMAIPVPAGDAFFDPDAEGGKTIPFNRSIYDSTTGTGFNNPRQQLNEISAWIDGSNVYGSDLERAHELRELDGSGRLKVSAGNNLPFNVNGLPNAGGSSAALFLAGDVRANEHVGLTAIHTLFVREHNRYAASIGSENPGLSGDQIFERARRMVIAHLQAISFNEFLPLLLGENSIGRYEGYDPSVDPSIANVFSTAAYRLGHSALNSVLLRVDAKGRTIPAGNISLRDAFFAPQRLTQDGGLDPLFRGFASQLCQSIDIYVIDDVRNFLFGAPGEGGFDLVSLNIQRGRDHGLASYNDVRDSVGLSRKQSFADINPDPEVQNRLAAAYASVDDIDVWVGGLAEPEMPGAMVGELIQRIVATQFTALRDGDRFWYEHALSREDVAAINDTRLSDIIRRNTSIGDELPDNVFRLDAKKSGKSKKRR